MMIDHHTGKLFWPLTMTHVEEYPALQGQEKVQVAIIGGGMSGISCGLVLARSGISACVIEREKVAGASTSANTGLLQFSNDVMLSELVEQIGKKDAVHFYRDCVHAVEQLALVAGTLPGETGFRRQRSLYYASSEQDLPRLRQEYKLLHENGFAVDYWEPDDIASRFPFRKPGAIVTSGDAEVNPYQFVQAMSRAAVADGLLIREHTDIVRHSSGEGGKHRLEAADGSVVEADHVIYAIGYEPEELRGKLVKAAINRSFAGVTGIQQSLAPWHQGMMIWETARPYLYMRTTVDGRVVIGGLDEENPHPVQGEAARQKRIDKLSKQLAELFPMLDSKLDYEWSAVFGESRDNLPFIGRDPSLHNVYYCLGYGGNGTVYSMMAAHMLRDLIQGESHPLEKIVGLTRPSLTEV
ncbi:NAD(P)/FAD-dependent oxidoreductase [Paenibacillus herberti]|nr:FAD-dependent oxidoreductase [Paenibacillus herberti]